MIKAIEHFKKLNVRRSDPSFWAANIIDSERLCESKLELKHFYAFITSPHTYDESMVENMTTLGDLEAQNKLEENKELYDPRLEPTVYKNGNEYTIHVKRVDNESEPDDEKTL